MSAASQLAVQLARDSGPHLGVLQGEGEERIPQQISLLSIRLPSTCGDLFMGDKSAANLIFSLPAQRHSFFFSGSQHPEQKAKGTSSAFIS